MEGAKSSAPQPTEAALERYCGHPYHRTAMEPLKQALQLRQLAQRIALSNHETSHQQAVLLNALTRMQKARPRLVASLRNSLVRRATKRSQNNKLRLWQALAKPDQVSAKELKGLLTAIRQTDAWQQACINNERHQSVWREEPWNHEARLMNKDELLKNLEAEFNQRQEVKLIFWHHFDALGYVPQSWQNVFAEIGKQGWVVVISSSGLEARAAERLKSLGCLISQRQNIGRCLGAYRDFCRLLDQNQNLRDCIKTLALCNDSVLPIGGVQPFCIEVDSIHQKLRTSKAKLIGLTDSVQTRAYHIQSYFLCVNSMLIKSPIWAQFWSRANLAGSKDELIQQGEIGLSQWLLRHNIPLEATYSLASILLKSPNISQTLDQLELRQPEEINTTLMCWNALINAGCPIVKKQLLLEPPHFLPQTVPIAKLGAHLTTADEDLAKDLQQLLQSRFFKP